MGALFDGYETARKKHEEQIAERRHREEVVDEHLHELVAVLEQDAAFLQKHGITHEIAGRTLRVNRDRSPVVTVHYEPDKAVFQVTYMRDGSHASATATAECAKAVGEMLFGMTVVAK